MLTVYEPLYIFGLRSLCFIMQSFEIRVRIEGGAKHDFFSDAPINCYTL